MRDQKTKNVGAHAYDLLQKEPETRDPIELQREMQKPSEWEEKLQGAVDSACKAYNGNFYIVILMKKERIILNSIRYYVVARQSCPTPQFDQMVYFYDRKVGDLRLVWVIPDQLTSIFMYQNALSVPTEQQELRDYVIDYFNGSLLQKALRLNKEVHNKEIYGSRANTATVSRA